MIFAAGYGTRMKELTRDRPKPLIEVAGESLLDRTLDLARGHGISRIVVNAHYRADMIERHLAGTEVAVAIETPDILDTGGGLRAALPMLGCTPVFTSNCDAVWSGPNPFAHLDELWEPDHMDALLLTVPIDRSIGRVGGGDFALAGDGKLSRGGSAVYTGVQIVKTDRLGEVDGDVFSLNRLWDLLAQSGRLYGAEYPGHWCDVGHPEGIGQAEEMLSST